MDRSGEWLRARRPFEVSGFAVLHGLLPPATCRSVVRLVDAVAASPSDPLMSRTGNELFPLSWDSELLSPILGSAPRLERVGSASGATDLRFVSAYVSLKRAHSAALGWHQDWWCWDHPISRMAAAPQVAVICYLQDVAIGGGALRVLPGSHLHSTVLHDVIPEAHSLGARTLSNLHPAMQPHEGELPLEMRAGDAVVLDYRLLHGTYANMTPFRRDALLLSFAPHWSELPAEVREHLALHPALPTASELEDGAAGRLGCAFPFFPGASTSLELNRTPSFESESDGGWR